ncbi:hypothetical protein R1sor_000437 [Riccia sorocarpa]|uniref:HMA domain-containing protein n=1 Tax=Riccia sorocarpa TaxID=122646 RepID=A0ABD3GW91_9MARC
MGGLLGNTKVARRGSGQGSSQCDIGNVPVYQCRDYSRGYPRTVVSSLPCHMGPPPGGYHDPYHGHHYPPAALPNTNQDLGYGEDAENWSESTLVYFGVGLVTIAILSKFIQDLLRSSSPRAPRPRPSSPKKAVVYSPPEHREEEWNRTGGEKESLLSMKHLFYGEPETVVILKTDDNTVRDNLHHYKYFGMHSEDSKGGPKPAEPVKQEGSGKKKQKGDKDESKKEEQKKDEGKKEESKDGPPKENGKSEDKKDAKSEEKKGGGKTEEKKGEAKSEGGKKKKGGAPADAAKDGGKKEEAPPPAATKEILLRVPMCCTECELTAAEALREVKGVIDIQCDYHEEKVAVTVVGDVQAPDLLLKCRSLKLFRKSSYWK